VFTSGLRYALGKVGSKLQPKLLLMTLHHLKVYPTEKQAEGPWVMTRKTYHKWVKYFKKKTRRLKAEKIVWPVKHVHLSYVVL
jgi:hypothetical protein